MGNYRKNLKIIAQWIVVALCLVYIVRFFVKNTDTLAAIKNIDAGMTCLICLTFLLTQLVTCWRFQLVLQQSSGMGIRLIRWLRIFMIGQFLSFVIPQSGNIYRSISLKREFGVTYTRYVAAFFAFTWMHVIQNLLLALVIILVVEPGFMIGAFRADILIAILLISGSAFPVLMKFILPQTTGRSSKFQWTRNKVSEVIHVTVSSLVDFKYMVRFLSSGIAIYIMSMYMFYLAFKVFGADVRIAPLAVFMVLLTLSSRVIITPGNLGLQELAFAIVSQHMNIGMDKGLLASAIIRVISVVIISGFGISMGGIDILKNYRKLD